MKELFKEFFDFLLTGLKLGLGEIGTFVLSFFDVFFVISLLVLSLIFTGGMLYIIFRSFPSAISGIGIMLTGVIAWILHIETGLVFLSWIGSILLFLGFGVLVSCLVPSSEEYESGGGFEGPDETKLYDEYGNYKGTFRKDI